MNKCKAVILGILILVGLSASADNSLLINHNANVYTAPTTHSEKLGRANLGEVYSLRSTSQTNGYYNIDYNDQSGFVYRRLAELTDVPASAGGTEEIFSIISWNMDYFGGSLSEQRKEMYKEAIPQVIADDVAVYSFQEVSNDDGAKTLGELLGDTAWHLSFKNSNDGLDNGIAYNNNRAKLLEDGFVFATVPDPNKSAKSDSSRAKHPIRWAYIKVGDFDFTLFSLHLQFDGGNATASARELKHLLDWLRDNYFNDPANDPDVIITGDFNLSTIAGKSLSVRSNEAGWIPLEKVIEEHGTFDHGTNQFFVFMDTPSTRGTNGAKNNYDHFIISKDVKDEEFVKVEMVDTQLIDNIDGTHNKLISDHYPIRGVFRSKGSGVALDSE